MLPATTAPAPKTAPGVGVGRSENRAWGFFGDSVRHAWEIDPQVVEAHLEKTTTGKKTAPGVPHWPSRDPIGKRGGLNLYGFVYNNPNRWIDILGLKIEVEIPTINPRRFQLPKTDPRYLDKNEWEADSKRLKEDLEEKLRKLEECCNKNPELADLGICRAFKDAKIHKVTITPQASNSPNAVPSGPIANAGGVGWPMPPGGPSEPHDSEIYSDPDGDGMYDLSNNGTGTLLAHEFEHVSGTDGLDPTPFDPKTDPDDARKYPNRGEKSAVEAENRIRCACPEFSGPLRDSYNTVSPLNLNNFFPDYPLR